MHGKGNILVTGGTGYVGGWAVDALLQAGYAVTILSRKPADVPGTTNLVADITDKTQLEILADKQFNAVLHLAAAGEKQDADTIREVNVQGTENLLEALQPNPPKKFIYLSTFKVYGQKGGHISESTKTSPATYYGTSKLSAEALVQVYCMEWGVPCTILRLSNAYGAPKSKDVGVWHLLFNDLCQNAYYHDQITLNAPPDTQLDMIWLGSVAQVIAQAIESPAVSGIYNLGAGKSIVTGQVAEAVGKAYQRYCGKTLTIAQPEPMGHSLPLVFDCQKLQAVLPYDTSQHFEEEALKVFALLVKEVVS